MASACTRAGFGGSNWLRYSNPEFERQVERASTAGGSSDAARAAWRAAIEILNADAPAVFLYSPDNVAAVHSRVADVRIRPDSWWALVRTWRIPADRLIDRDRASGPWVRARAAGPRSPSGPRAGGALRQDLAENECVADRPLGPRGGSTA